MPGEDDWSDERHVWVVRASNGDPVGPVSIAQIAQAIAFGKLGDADQVRHVIFPRRRGQRDYAAIAPVCDLNSNSIGLT
jgi:hypothetical protein